MYSSDYLKIQLSLSNHFLTIIAFNCSVIISVYSIECFTCSSDTIRLYIYIYIYRFMSNK